MRLFRPFSSTFLAIVLAVPVVAADRAVTNTPADDNAAEANVFVNAKLIAIQRDQIQIRDNTGKKRTLALVGDANIERPLKAGNDVILAIKDDGGQEKVLSVRRTTTGGALLSSPASPLLTVPGYPTDISPNAPAASGAPAGEGLASAQVAMLPALSPGTPSGSTSDQGGSSGYGLPYNGMTGTVLPPGATLGSTTIGATEQSSVNANVNEGLQGADAAPLPAAAALQAYTAGIARAAQMAGQVDRAFGLYKDACIGPRSTVANVQTHEWFGVWDGATTPSESRGECESLVQDAVRRGREVQQVVAASEDIARHAGVLPGVTRQVRAAYGMDWAGWDR
jgi:hypothetical protein